MTLDADLTKLTAEELQLRLMQHQVERPPTNDPGFLKWVETKDAIKFHLELKQIEAREAWKPAPEPAHPRGLGFSKNRPTVDELPPEPKSAPPPISEPELPMPRKATTDKPKRPYVRKKPLPEKKAKAKKVDEKPPRKAKVVHSDPEPARSLDRPLDLAIDLGRAIERHVTTPAKVDDIRASIRGIRRQTWQLMADLENLTPEQQAALADEISLLDAAVATAYTIASRAAVA